MYRSQTPLDVADQLQLTNVDGEGLGFSLTPPSWLRDAFTKAVRGTEITVQTPIGPQSIRLDDPAAAKALIRAVSPRVTFGPPPPPSLVEQVPGGFGTVALVGLGAIALLMFMGRR